MRTRVVAGNWKMNGTLGEAHALVRQLLNVDSHGVDVVVCPPFTALSSVAQLLKGSSIGLGAQNMFSEPQGAYTGEVSAAMLLDAGCQYVILGHSERRAIFGETNERVRKKVIAALAAGLIPIVCVGETLADREADRTLEVILDQLGGAFKTVMEREGARVILAYEPVWAIGTGRNATPEQAQEIHHFIRRWVANFWNEEIAASKRVLYGGSVNAANAASLLQQPDVDGALVGGASLKADAFATIITAAKETKVVVHK